MTDKTILWVIDKDKNYQDTLRLQLDYFSHALQVVSYYDAEVALMKLKTEDLDSHGQFPDIILLDLNMPVMDGWDFWNEYAAIKQELPRTASIYIVTSSIRKQDLQAAAKNPDVTGYKTKPLDMQFFEGLSSQSRSI